MYVGVCVCVSARHIIYSFYRQYVCSLIKIIISDVAAALLQPSDTEVWLKQQKFQSYIQLHIQLVFGAPTGVYMQNPYNNSIAYHRSTAHWFKTSDTNQLRSKTNRHQKSRKLLTFRC